MIKEWLDDIAVLLLFSVFEANIRDLVESQVRPEVDRLQPAALKSAGEDVLQSVAEGSFFRVLEPLKSPQTYDLIEQDNQIRRYRNWVAHGRGLDRKPDATVIPKEAYNRLSALLELLRPSSLQDRDDRLSNSTI